MKTYTFESKSFQITYKQPEKHVYIEIPITEDTHGKIAKWLEVDGEEDHFEKTNELSWFLGDRKQYGITSALVSIPEFESTSCRREFLLKNKDELLKGFEIIKDSEFVFREVKISALSEYFYYLVDAITEDFSLGEIYEFLCELDLNLAEGLPMNFLNVIWDAYFDVQNKNKNLTDIEWVKKLLEILGVKGYQELVNYTRIFDSYDLWVPEIFAFYSDIPVALWTFYINSVDKHYSLTDSDKGIFKSFEEIKAEMLETIKKSKNFLQDLEIKEILEGKGNFYYRKRFVSGLIYLFEEINIKTSIQDLREKRMLISYLLELFKKNLNDAKPKLITMTTHFSSDYQKDIQDGTLIKDKDSKAVKGVLIRETGKAALIKFPNRKPDWIPKSQIKNNYQSTVNEIQVFCLTNWISDKKGIYPTELAGIFREYTPVITLRTGIPLWDRNTQFQFQIGMIDENYALKIIIINESEIVKTIDMEDFNRDFVSELLATTISKKISEEIDKNKISQLWGATISTRILEIMREVIEHSFFSFNTMNSINIALKKYGKRTL